MAVTIYRPPADRFFGPVVDATVVRNLRVTFQIEKHLGSEPNTCDVSLFNLAPTTRYQLQQKPLKVQLDAGYDGQPHRLFVGDLRWSEPVRDSVDWELKMQLGDGERATRHARVNRSYRSGVTSRDAVVEVARAMGLEVPDDVLESVALRAEFASGLTLQGPASRELTRVLARHGLEWSIQDGRLQILAPDDVRPDQALVISQEAGMIGSPEYGSPPEKGKPAPITIRCLLYPQINPGSRVQVKSRTISGFFKVQRVTHAGDTHGADWTTEVECRPV